MGASNTAPDRPILAVDGLSVSYGHVQALRNASITIGSGEIVVLLGANGAGKTTLMESILGIHTPHSGSISFDGTDITRVSADRNVRSGISLVPEGRGIFSSMTVLDNLLLGAHHNLQESPARLDRVFHWFPVLRERQQQMAGTLSGGERRMLAIGRALMSRPRLILIDEPSIGLAPKIVNDIFAIIADLNAEGYAILLSEQNAYKALKTSNRGYVLETGRVVLEGASAELLDDPGIKAAYVGA